MRVPCLCLIALLSLDACATEPQASLENRMLSFSCDDVVAIGRLKNGSFQLVRSEDDLLGHGWVSATLRVRKVIKGAQLPPVLSVTYFAHTYMRDGRDFMFVLKRTLGGTYQIKTGQLMSLRPLLPSHCE